MRAMGHPQSLAFSVLARQHPTTFSSGARDEDHALPRGPDAVHVDDVVDLVARGDDRPEPPEVVGAVAERPHVDFELGLGELPRESRHEGSEPPRRRVVLGDLGAAARCAPPSVRAHLGPAVFPHRRTADIAFSRRQRSPPPPKADFSCREASLNRGAKRGSDTLFHL